MPPLRLRESTRQRLRERVADLSARFGECLAQFHCVEQFDGPSLHFHLRTINRLRLHQDAAEVLDDEEYFEHLYATLTSWGLHRMGPGRAKLRDFPVFRRNARSLLGDVKWLFGRSMLEMRAEEASIIARQLGEAIQRHKRERGLTQAESVLVANAKALHHFLPDLVPPIDRAYTLMFLFNRIEPPGSESETFGEMFPHLVRVAQENGDLIRRAVTRGMRDDQHANWDSGHAKVIDNALIGWMRDARVRAEGGQA